MNTPTQSPLQKTGRLQSVVTVVCKEPPKGDSTPRDRDEGDVTACRRADGTFMTAPYHLIGAPGVIAEQFVLYCTDRFSRDDFVDEVDDFGGVFGHRTAFIVRYCMATVVYFEVAWIHDERWIFPNIPPEMEKMTSRRGVSLPASPKESVKCTGDDVAVRCLKRWRYFLALMQFWKDEMTPFQYGGIVRFDSKVLLYIMFQLKAVLRSVDFQFHHYAVKNTTTWNDFARQKLTSDQVTADRKAHQKMHDELTSLKRLMQHRYEEEADLEWEILQRIRGDIDCLMVHREDRCCHPGNEEEYRLRQKLAAEQDKGRGAQGALNQERETRDQHRVSESREWQQYTREREEQIAFEQSEPYPSPMYEPDPPTQTASAMQEGGVKAKTKVSLEEYRDRCLQKEAAEAKERRDRELMEARKAEHARLHEIEIQEAEMARIRYEEQQRLEEEHVRKEQEAEMARIKYEEQQRLEEERAQKEQEANAKLLATQAQQVPKVLGSHTPCFDEHGQELDYYDDVIATESQDCRSWSEYFRQQRDLGALAIADSLDGEARLLQGPTLEPTAREEAVLLEEETPVIDMKLFLAGLETLTPSMLTEVSTRIEHLRRMAAPLASAKSTKNESPPPPPGLPAMPTVVNPMEQALLRVTGDLGTSPSRQGTSTRPPSEDEAEHAAALLVWQMAKMTGTPSPGHDPL